MSAARHLRVIDGNGEILDTASPEETVHALQAALTRAERSNRQLKRQLAEEREKAKRTYPIDAAFEDWRAKLVAAGFKSKGQCKLSPDRIDRIKEMFEAGYTLGHFELVNTGIASFPYEVYGKRRQSGPDDKLEVDIGRVCEKARRFEEAARLGAIVNKAREA